jgi:MFS family permease
VVARFGPRRVITTGMLSSAAGMLLLSGVAPGGTYVNPVLLGAVLSAVGMGLTLVPATIMAMQGVERAQSGVASGLLNTSRLMGGALGLAVLSTLATSQTHSEIGTVASRALSDGFDLAFTVAAVFALAGAAIAGVALRPRETEAAEVRAMPERLEPDTDEVVAA